MEIIAHRGACFEAPENSLEAFELAIVQGADRLELDVQITSDGVPIVCHDRTTARTTDRDLEIEFHTWEELQTCRMENGERLPTLAEVADLASKRVLLDVEFKALTPESAKRILRELEESGADEDMLLTSFDPDVLRQFRVLGWAGRSGLLVGSPSLNVRQRAYEAWPLGTLREAQCTELVIHHRLSHRVLRRSLSAAGYGFIVWTAVEDERKDEEARAELYRRVNAQGPAGIIVGRVAEARAVLRDTPDQDAV